jgi:hypothetical protein
MFWDQKSSNGIPLNNQQIFKKNSIYYRILETEKDRSSRHVWHKLFISDDLWYLIFCKDSRLRGHNWDIVKEIDGTSFIWVTDQYLTVLQIQGAENNDSV